MQVQSIGVNTAFKGRDDDKSEVKKPGIVKEGIYGTVTGVAANKVMSREKIANSGIVRFINKHTGAALDSAKNLPGVNKLPAWIKSAGSEIVVALKKGPTKILAVITAAIGGAFGLASDKDGNGVSALTEGINEAKSAVEEVAGSVFAIGAAANGI